MNLTTAQFAAIVTIASMVINIVMSMSGLTQEISCTIKNTSAQVGAAAAAMVQ
jgi:hypothetical protein